MIKVHILFELKDGATGGGNQFLKALKSYFIDIGCYVENYQEANVVLYNSYQFIPELIYVKNKFSDKIFIHRIDGPIRLYNVASDQRDFVVYSANQLIADGTIFQSDWSKEKNFSQGMSKNTFESTIINAPNPNIFNTNNKKLFDYNQKIRLIATSWSSNFKKGFATYQWLDENLDFSRYEMSFVGNSPINFKNIHNIPPLDTNELAKALKNSDIFITASQKDPCSNSLIEALHCGLPAIVLKDGGHPELLRKGGEVFVNAEEIPDLLDKIVADYSNYQNNIQMPSLEQVGEAYYKFMENVFIKTQQGEYIPKKFSWFDYFKIKKTLVWWRSKQRLIGLKRRIGLK